MILNRPQDEYGWEAFQTPVAPEVADPFVVPAPPAGPVALDPVPEPIVVTAPNGEVAVLEPPLALTNGLVNGIEGDISEIIEPPQPAPPPPVAPPKIYNMDLEKIQKYLYKEKYLTAQEFLEDLEKIVHNTTVYRADNDRMVKAQMMLTMAQVLTNEWDAHFKLECERMAGRERKRREQWARDHPKRKEDSESHQQPNGQEAQVPRRSARNNGQEPEISITDPLKLERKLKRQRSSEATSPEESQEDGPNKRARLSGDEDERDPLDLVGPTSSQHRPATVRFAELEQSSPTPMSDVVQEQHLAIPPFTVNPNLTSLPSPEPSQTPPQDNPSDTMEIFQPEEPLPPRSPSPEPHPPFFVPEDDLQTLHELIATLTTTFNIEQLEQLRAACLSCLWRRRSEWDRSGMISELSDLVRTFAQEASQDHYADI